MFEFEGDSLAGEEGEEWEEFRAVPDDDEESGKPSAPGGSRTAGATGASALGEKEPPQERSVMPKWLYDDYADTRERLADEIRNNTSKRPTCYERSTFIDGSPSPFFAADHKFQPTPELFYRPHYFVWLPHLLVARIPCPGCTETQQKSPTGGAPLLQARGWVRAPRHVVDLEECVYIIGHRYMCGTCKKSYQSWSPVLLAALPRSLAMEFPFHLTHRSGLTDSVVALMRASFQHGIGPGPFAEMVRTNHIRHYEKLHLQYLEMVYARLHSATAKFLAKFRPFGLFDDCDGYAGFTPSPHYFRNFYVIYISSHAGEMDQFTALLSGSILQIDHSYKVISLCFASL